MRKTREGLLGHDDEIDFLRVMQVLWQGRWYVVFTTILAILVGVFYIYLAKPEYEASVYVQLASQDDIASLNVGRGTGTGLDFINVNQVYSVFVRNLQSESVRRKFYREIYLPSMQHADYPDYNDAKYREFNQKLQVALVDKAFPTRYSITARAEDGATALSWVGKFAEIASGFATRELVRNAKSDANVKADNIQLQIDIGQQSAKKQREDQIAQLKEALRIAKSIGLEKPPLISANLSTELSSEVRGGLTYMRGAKALEAEITNLEARQSDDPYIADLRKKQADLAFYRGIRVDPTTVQVYQQDGGVVVTDQPVAPKRSLVLAIACMAGLLLGAFFVLARTVWGQIITK